MIGDVKVKFCYLEGKNNQYIARDPTGKIHLVSNIQDALSVPITERKKMIVLKKNNIPNVLKKFGPFDIKIMDNADAKLAEVTADDMAGDIINSFNQFSTHIEQISGLSDELSSIISYTDLELSDMLHYIEFHKFSASEGYQLCKKIQEICDRRRDAKNKLQIICTVNSQSCKKILSGDAARDITNAINKKRYTPRILEKMFEDNKSRERTEKSVNIKLH